MGEDGEPEAAEKSKIDSAGDHAQDQSTDNAEVKSSTLLLIVNITALLLSLLLTIVSTAVPRITSQFHSLNDVGWYGSAFFLTMAIFQALWGKIFKYFPLKISFMFSILIFELGTLGCAVSRSSSGFIAGRAVAGIGAAGVIGGTYTILAHIVAPDKIPMVYGLSGLVFTVASVAGPVIGGAFTSDVSWRWCFYLNLPIGGFTVALLALFLRLPESAAPPKTTLTEKALQMDLPGVIVAIGALLCYLFALRMGGITTPWSSSKVIGLLVGWIILSACFVVIEVCQKDKALVPPHFLRHRGIVTCSVFGFFLNCGNYLRFYYLPIYFQAVDNASAQRSGVYLLALLVPISIFTLLAGATLGKVGYYQPYLVFGACILTVSSGLIYTLDEPFSTSRSIGYLLLTGFAEGLVTQVPVTAVQAFVPKSDLPTVTATVLLFQLGSGVIGLTAGESVFTNRMLSSLPKYAPGVNGAEVLSVGAYALEATFNPVQLRGIRRAYLAGLKDVWIMTIAFGGAALVTALFAPPISILAKTEGGDDATKDDTKNGTGHEKKSKEVGEA